ncbi:BLUF domain-containing protein [Stieleria varia]|uniref:Blue light-and temperature-regulated antirepressor YcgF n=1 Tax=Stieleria varia TaxID=2528005 RepID=A0A5C5ZRE5_9BACT|nr:BLUF domain-containing protein [Stieleria varia]TWT89477.1 Blue light- and temperature-regulated antirepressor YcgF [Stieleria varia]
MSIESSNPSLIQLVYASAATVEFSDEMLRELLRFARDNNHSLNVTGVLLFIDGTFFQVLEGEPQVVHSLYEKIEKDPRHTNVLQLASREIEERNFGQWSMGYIENEDEVKQLPGFVDFFNESQPHRPLTDLKGDHERIQLILEGFRRGRWRRHAQESAAT